MTEILGAPQRETVKEAVAMALEPFGKVRVVQVIDGKEVKRK